MRWLERNLDSAELSEWMAFYQLEPFGSEWRQTANLSALMANCWAKRSRPFEPKEFLPVQREQTAAEQQAIARAFAFQFGATHGHH